MNNLTACCGIDCAGCDARIATINNDDNLRRETAEKWSAMFNAEITSETIDCTGCREEGAKFGYCDLCGIRGCVKSKGYDTCADCVELDTCPILKQVTEHLPEASENLKSLKS